MGKWLAIIIIGIALLIGGLYGFGKYIMQHATEEGSFSAGVYEKTMEGRLLTFCNKLVKQYAMPDETNTEAQYKSACNCFANDMFEKFRGVPPEELEDFLNKKETQKSAENIFKKCGYQSGLN